MTANNWAAGVTYLRYQAGSKAENGEESVPNRAKAHARSTPFEMKEELETQQDKGVKFGCCFLA